MGAMARRGWARITDSVADILRRGAWYPVVDETPDGHVVVDVRQGVQVRLKREDVTMRSEPPTTWSVVVRTGVLRPTLGGSNSSLGGLVQGLGSTVNNTLQQLGGTR